MSCLVLQNLTQKVNLRFGGTDMKLRDYIENLDDTALSAYATRCRIAISYMRLHVKYASKDPSVTLIRALTCESDGYVSLSEVLEHFGITQEAIERKAA